MGIPSKYLDQTVTILSQSGSTSYDDYGNISTAFSTASSSVKARLERMHGALDIDDEDLQQYTQYDHWRMWCDVSTSISQKDRVQWTYNSEVYDFDVMDVDDQVESRGFHHKLCKLVRVK